MEHELQPIKLGKMFARRNDTTVESGLHQNISMHTQGSDVATTMVTQGSPTSVVAIENFIKNGYFLFLFFGLHTAAFQLRNNGTNAQELELNCKKKGEMEALIIFCSYNSCN